MKSLRMLLVVAIAIAGLLAFTGGSTVSLAQLPAASYKFFIVSHGGAIDPFWAVVRRGMEDAAATLNSSPGLKIAATYFGPEVASIPELVRLLDSAIAAKPDGLAVTITDPTAVGEPLRRAIAQGIPIIAINVPDIDPATGRQRPEEERIPYKFYIGGDEYLGGVRAAKALLKAAEAKGVTINRGVCAPQEVGHIGLETRCKGFADVMAERGIPADKLQIYGADPTRSVEILRSYFAAHPETNALFTTGPQGTLPAVTFLKEAGLVGKVLHGTFDLDPVTLDAIRTGVTLFAIVQQQYLQGFLPIVFLTLYNQFLLSPISDVLTGPALVDATNIEQVAKLIERGYW